MNGIRIKKYFFLSPVLAVEHRGLCILGKCHNVGIGVVLFCFSSLHVVKGLEHRSSTLPTSGITKVDFMLCFMKSFSLQICEQY